MRRCYLVCYDIRDSRRLARIHKLMKGYGQPWQYSAFYCTLKEIDLVRLKDDLEERMNLKEDQVFIIDLGNDEEKIGKSVVFLGQMIEESAEGIDVI